MNADRHVNDNLVHANQHLNDTGTPAATGKGLGAARGEALAMNDAVKGIR